MKIFATLAITATLAPCGQHKGGTRSVTEDHLGLST